MAASNDNLSITARTFTGPDHRVPKNGNSQLAVIPEQRTPAAIRCLGAANDMEKRGKIIEWEMR
jgi:hypothetical protein